MDPPSPVCVNRTGDPNTAVPPRCLTFAGREWVVKNGRFDPGPNNWSDSPDSVWVDALGRLHLTIRQRNNTWFTSEVVLNESLGFGAYTFQTSGAIHQLDRNVVLGLFTYDYVDPAFAHREIDIEYSLSLGSIPGANAHFTVQPFQTPGNTFDFVSSGGTTHSIDWTSGRVMFASGGQTWTYAGGSVPQPGRENVRMNLWLFNGSAPLNGADVEVVVTDFQFRR